MGLAPQRLSCKQPAINLIHLQLPFRCLQFFFDFFSLVIDCILCATRPISNIAVSYIKCFRLVVKQESLVLCMSRDVTHRLEDVVLVPETLSMFGWQVDLCQQQVWLTHSQHHHSLPFVVKQTCFHHQPTVEHRVSACAQSTVTVVALVWLHHEAN